MNIDRSSRRYGVIQYNHNQFDPSNGQAFAEMTVRARPRRYLSRPNPARSVHISHDGPESLEKLALREFLRYVQDTTQDTMDELTEILTLLPWNLGQRVWEEAQKRDLQSPLIVWRSFTTAYPGEEKIGYHRAATNMPDPDDLPLYIERMNSDNYSWLTCLTVTEHRPQVSFRRPDVINISRLRNLAALDIGTSDIVTIPNEMVDDSVMRSWARLVHESQSFRKLQVLIIRNQPGVTLRALEYLSNFPMLTLFGIKECFEITGKAEQAAKSFGWTSVDEHGIVAQVQRDISRSSTWDEPIRQFFKRSSTLLTPSTVTDLPLLNFRLGPTPSSILFSNTYSPLVFFRCLHCSTSQTQVVVPIISHSVHRKSSTPARAQDSFAKRRKLKKEVDLTNCFSELFANERGDRSGNGIKISDLIRPFTIAAREDRANHQHLEPLRQTAMNSAAVDTIVEESKVDHTVQGSTDNNYNDILGRTQSVNIPLSKTFDRDRPEIVTSRTGLPGVLGKPEA